MSAVSGITIDRREAIRRVTALLGGVALVGADALWAHGRAQNRPIHGPTYAFTPEEIALLDEIAETILPETKTPGAKAAKVGAFMALMVTDCYEERDQKIFRDGMQRIDQAIRDAGQRSFLAASPAARLTLLEALDREQKTYMDAKAERDPSHFFRMMKELTLLGYFTSEIGCTQALRYVETPGKFEPCLPYQSGETLWAAHG